MELEMVQLERRATPRAAARHGTLILVYSSHGGLPDHLYQRDC